MRWLVCDSLMCPEAFFASHLDSYSHYLREYGEDVRALCPRLPRVADYYDPRDVFDVGFSLDHYQSPYDATVRIAQVAAICNPMPWDVRNPDGSPVYDLILSSLRWMVEEAKAKGCRAEFMPLAFDVRALVCGMGVERDIDFLFCGTRGANHARREEVIKQIGDRLHVAPPTFGRGYFKLLARARIVLNVHAEWARGEENNMRMYEAAGMGAKPFGYIEGDPAQMSTAEVFERHLYTHRIPRIVELARELMEAKR